ncbi:MAG: transposase [Bradyrhizobiaceae bacterium]|nr:transposase [Bradyrhizobiaceae bacterium]
MLRYRAIFSGIEASTCSSVSSQQQQERADHLQAIESERAERVKHEKQNEHYQDRVFSLEFQVRELQRLIFCSKRERFISNVHPSQLAHGLVVDPEVVDVAVEAAKEVATNERRKPGKKHQGHMALPEHLPVVEMVIEPWGDLTGMKRIGAEVTEELELQPAKVFIKRTTRPWYAAPEAEDGSVQILIAPIPPRPIDKC